MITIAAFCTVPGIIQYLIYCFLFGWMTVTGQDKTGPARGYQEKTGGGTGEDTPRTGREDTRGREEEDRRAAGQEDRGGTEEGPGGAADHGGDPEEERDEAEGTGGRAQGTSS